MLVLASSDLGGMSVIASFPPSTENNNYTMHLLLDSFSNRYMYMHSTHMLTVFQLEFDGRFEIESFNQSSIL